MAAVLSQPLLAWSPPPPSTGAWATSGYQGGRTRALWAQATLGLAIGVAGLSALVVANGIGLLDRAVAGTATQTEFFAFTNLTEDLDNLSAVLQLASAICVLAWLHRAVANVPSLGRGTPRWSPWQSVIWWFVPLAFLVMPFAIVRDVWRRMSPAGDQTSSAVVGGWWILYLAGSLGSRAASQAAATASTVEELRSLFLAVTGLLVATAISGVLLIWVIRTVESRAAHLATLGIAQAPVAPAGPFWGAPETPVTLGPNEPLLPPSPATPMARAPNLPPPPSVRNARLAERRTPASVQAAPSTSPRWGSRHGANRRRSTGGAGDPRATDGGR